MSNTTLFIIIIIVAVLLLGGGVVAPGGDDGRCSCPRAGRALVRRWARVFLMS